MKVRVSFTVDIDVDEWMANYGIERDDVRADVQTYVQNGVIEHLRGLGLLGDQQEAGA